jgi:hypothetical protein
MTLATGLLGASVLQTQAAEPAQVKPAVSCSAKQAHSAKGCPVKNIRAQAQVVQPTKAALNLQVCERLQSQVERDTCLNRVEATA